MASNRSTARPASPETSDETTRKNASAGPTEFPGAVSESAQQIWQAGLGAFTRAQMEGSKTFEALVREGVEIQRKTQEAAEQKISEATHRISDFATQLSTGASGQWGRLSSIFEDRVARALETLGIPTATEMAALASRVEALEAALEKALQANAAARSAPPDDAPSPRRKSPPRRTKES